MQKKFITTYILIFITLLVMMSLSRHTSDKMRGRSVALFAPFWEKLLTFKYFLTHPFQSSPLTSFSLEEEKQQLQIENQLLSTELVYLQQILQEQLLRSSQISQIASLSPDTMQVLSQEQQKILEKIVQQLNWRLKAVPARVIFRSFDLWNSSLWINVGELTNQIYQAKVIAKNSPVVVGSSIVGIIDYVGKHQSRVQLMTDNRLTPSVRAARGGEQEILMIEQVEGILQQLNRKKQIPLSPNDQMQLSSLLKQLKKNLQPLKKSWYLAKGELLGSSSFSRRGQDIILKGTGFNYDFADEEGEGYDLRTGKPVLHPEEPSIPILKVHDVLVTTGMDGIFPSGFQVATVTRVDLLKEGDYFYHLEARPIAGSLEELSLVFVLPPLTTEDP